MTYTVALPDGRIVEFPDNVPQDKAAEIIRAQLGIGEGKTGLGAALGKGTESTLSQLRSGLAGLFGSPEEAARAGLERGKKIGEEYADQVSAERIIQAFKEKGVLPGIGEAVSQVPYALAEQVPNMATMLGGAGAGRIIGGAVGAVGGPPGIALGQTIGGGLGALGASALQQFGGNIERQAQVQQERKQPVAIDVGGAGAAALGQGALDVVSMAIPLGGRMVSRLTGIPLEGLLGKTSAQMRKLADERLLTTISKGLATGMLAEIPTEVAQQALERAQAGLSLTDEDAMREYGQTAIEVGLLAPFGATGRLSERTGAKQFVEREEQTAKATAQRAQLELEERQRRQREVDEAAETARKQTVPYALEALQTWHGYQQQVADLKARTKAKVDPDDDLGQADKKEATTQLKALRGSAEFKTAFSEFRRVLPILKQEQARQAQEQAQRIQQEQDEQERQRIAAMSPQEYMLQSYIAQMQQQLAAETNPARKRQMSRQLAALQGQPIQGAPAVDTGMVDLAQKGFPPAPTAVDTYVQDQYKLAQQFGHEADMETLLPYYLQDPGMAAQMVAQNIKVPGLRAAQNREFLGAIQEELAAAEEQRRQTEAEQARRAQERQLQQQRAQQALTANQQLQQQIAGFEGAAPIPLAEQQRQLAEQQRLQEEALREEEEKQKREESLVGQLVTSTQKQFPATAATPRVVAGVTPTDSDAVTNLRAQINYAQATRNRPLEQQLRTQLEQLGERGDEIPGSALGLGKTAQEAGVEGELPPAAMAQNRATRLAQKQLLTFDALTEFIDDVRTREQRPISDATKTQLKYRAEQLKQATIGYGLLEIDHRRQAAGLPELTDRQRLRAAVGLARPLDELITRGAQTFEQPVAQRAVVRGAQTIESATEPQRPPAGQRTFSERGFMPAATSLREQFRTILDNVTGVPQTQAVAAERKPLGPPRRVIGERPPGLPAPLEGATASTQDLAQISQQNQAPTQKLKNSSNKLSKRAQAAVDQAANAWWSAEQRQLTAPTPLQSAERALVRAKEQNRDLLAEADRMRAEQLNARLKIATEIEALEQQKAPLDRQLDDLIQGYLRVESEQLGAQEGQRRAPVSAAAVFEQANKLMPYYTQQITSISDSLSKLEASLTELKAQRDALQKAQDDDIVGQALLRQAGQAESKIARAQAKVQETKQTQRSIELGKEKAAQEALKPLKEPTAAEQLAQLPLAGIERVYKDTNDPAVRERAKNLRKSIAKAEGRFEAAEAAADKEGMASARQALTTLHDELYNTYENAPRVRVEGKTQAELEDLVKEQQRQHEVHNDEIEAFNAAHETANIPLPQRRIGPIVSERGRPGRQAGERQPRIEPPVSRMNELAQARATQADIERRLNYINENKAATVEGRRRQQQTKADLKQQLAAVKDEIKGLVKTQTAVRTEEREVGRIIKKAKRVSRKALKGETPYIEEPQAARGVEVESPDLTDSQVEDLARNNVTAALSSIAEDNSSSELNRAVASRLAVLLDETRVEVVDRLTDNQGKEVLGMATSKLIRLNRDGGLSQEILLHEGAHAGVERVLQMPEDQLTAVQRVAKRELQMLFSAVKNDPSITSVNAKSSLSEFAAEVMSNRNLQQQLSKKKWRLSNAWEGFKSILLRLLGIERPETMLGAALQSVDALMIPSSEKVSGKERPVSRRLSQKDIAALHTGSNSMRQFAENFGQFIKQKDRTPEDVDRIGKEYLLDMDSKPLDYVERAEANRLDYKSATIMSDGKEFDPENPLHRLEATPETYASLEALKDPAYRTQEAYSITQNRKEALRALVNSFVGSRAYTLAEMALVAKAASKYAVTSTKDGRLQLATIAANNRHPVAVVGEDAAKAVIEELRAGKSLKEAFLDGLQKNADASAKRNSVKQGWQKFEQSDEEAAAVALNAGAANTSWCTGSNVDTARSQLQGGDFYIYYENGRPEVAVRMNGQTNIGEIRGNTPQQWLTDKQQQIAHAFLQAQNWPSAKKYIDEVARKDALTRIFSDKMRPGDSKVIADVMNSALTMPEYAINSLFNFKLLNGYLKQPPINQNFIDKVQPVLKNAIDTDYAAGYAYFAKIDVHAKKIELRLTDGSEVKTLSPEQTSKLKAVKELVVYGTVSEDSKNAFASLEQVNKMHLFSSVQLPNIKQVEEIVVFDTPKQKIKLTLGSDAVVDNIRGYDQATVEINGGYYMTVDALSGSGILSATINDAPYVRAKTLKPKNTNFLATAFKNALTATLEDTLSRESGGKINSWAGYERALRADDPNKRALAESITPTVNAFVKKAVKDLPQSGQTAIGEWLHNVELGEIPESENNAAFVDDYFFMLRQMPFEDWVALNKKVNDAKLFGDRKLLTQIPTVEAPSKIADVPPPPATTTTEPQERFLYAPKITYANPELAAVGAIGDKFIARNKSAMDMLRANNLGLAFETSIVDRFAGYERLAKLMPSLQGTQMMYYLRMYDQRMNFVAQSVGNGALQLVKHKRADGQNEYIIESVPGPSLAGVAKTLTEAKPITGSVDAANRLFTMYLSAIRAKDKGFDALHLGDVLTEAELNAAMKTIQATPGLDDIFKRARKEYNDYNRAQIEFAINCGAMPEALGEKLLKENDYIPWYREQNGLVTLTIGKETPIRIGSIAEQPYLHELVGSGKPILDFFTSSVQNTNMLTDMSMRNLSTKNAVFELQELGLAKIGRKPMSGPTVVHFRMEPENDKDSGDRYALIDTDAAGVPADILVKGMEGIPTQMSMISRLMAMPATILRRTVMATPLMAAKQLFRDPAASALTAGADIVPVMDSLKEIGGPAKTTLERRGITGGQMFTGTTEDLSKILRDIANNKTSWQKFVTAAESLSLEADAATRAAQYNSYIKQGLSEMEASLMALEAMNFSKRGASPSIHWLNSQVPFLNAQIQSLNVLYKALFGKMPFNEKLKIQEKLLTRGAMIAGTTLAYAAAMQDDEAYKNATPDQKYNNIFVRVPGVDEPLKLPIPFEVGYIFKALPEALFNIMKNEHGSDEAFKAFNQILIQIIPGGTSMPALEVGRARIPIGLPVPQAIKTPTELALGKSFYTGRDILTAHEKTLMPEAQFRPGTTEAAKAIGQLFHVSPIGVEQVAMGYTGALGLAFLQAVSTGIPATQSPAQATQRWSDMPVIGGAFQPNDAGGIISNVYDRMRELQEVKKTVDDYINRGEKARAKELIAKQANAYAAAEVADFYVTTMREFTQYETAIRASSLTEDQKRQQLDRVRQAKIRFAEMVRQASDKAIPR